jgi:hypothetical protein
VITWRGAVGQLAAAIVMAWGCAGDGTGLGAPGNLVPTLSSIQENIFTPICTRCHTGAAAPLGMPLDAGVARQNLVGVASVEVPTLLRVNPGEPDSSYLVWKIEGRPGLVGGRMPLGFQPLSQEQIAAVKEWVEGGALND